MVVIMLIRSRQQVIESSRSERTDKLRDGCERTDKLRDGWIDW